MRRSSFARLTLFLFIVCTTAISAHAQATRTWVASSAGGGDDANPCSRTAPCATFAGAISKTSEGGEIDAIEPGSYGSVTITKAITIDGGTGAGWAGILATQNSNGIIVNINTSGINHPDSADVILRNLSINGAKQAGTGGDVGIKILRCAQVHVQNVSIQNFSNQGIRVDAAEDTELFVENVMLTRDKTAIRLETSAGVVLAQLNHINVQGSDNGVYAVANARAAVRDSYFGRTDGTTTGAVRAASGCVINIENSMFSHNELAVNCESGGTVRISNNCFYNNTTALSGAGTIATATNTNKFAGNGTDGNTNDVITLK
jgi:hypothetical protein